MHQYLLCTEANGHYAQYYAVSFSLLRVVRRNNLKEALTSCYWPNYLNRY